MEKLTAFKYIINPDLVMQISSLIKQEDASFDDKSFLKIKKELVPLEMKARTILVAKTMSECFKSPIKKNLITIANIAKKGELKMFELWPFSTYVELYGLGYLKESLDAMEEITKYFTAEYCVRPFLQNDNTRNATLKRLHLYTKSSNIHLRRLATEGTRPRLPWGAKLHDFITTPDIGIGILEKLKYDDAEYVRKSVANHLNDLSKDHPKLIREIITKWEKNAPAKHREKIEWIKKHALRTLVKLGDKETLKMFEINDNAKFEIKNFTLKKDKISLGENLEFSFELKLTKGHTSKIIIDYGLGLLRKNGEHNIKIFKGKNLDNTKLPYTFSKKHPIKLISTRTFYLGLQFLTIQVNGQELKRIGWQLI